LGRGGVMLLNLYCYVLLCINKEIYSCTGFMLYQCYLY
jgi:hypothetical protein